MLATYLYRNTLILVSGHQGQRLTFMKWTPGVWHSKIDENVLPQFESRRIR